MFNNVLKACDEQKTISTKKLRSLLIEAELDISRERKRLASLEKTISIIGDALLCATHGTTMIDLELIREAKKG